MTINVPLFIKEGEDDQDRHAHPRLHGPRVIALVWVTARSEGIALPPTICLCDPHNLRFRPDFVCNVCVICGNFGCKKEKIDKQSRQAQFQAQPQSCAQRRTGADTRSGVGSAHGPDPLGKICFCDFPSSDLRNSQSDIFYRFRARDRDAALLGGRRILVFFIGRSSVADCFFRSSAPDPHLCLRTRIDPRAVGLVDGWPREPVSRWP